MKRRISGQFDISFNKDGEALPVDDIASIKLVFKKRPREDEPATVTLSWDGTDGRIVKDAEAGCFTCGLTADETALFGEFVWIDSHVTTNEGVELETPVVRKRVAQTLFSEEESR